PPPLLLLFLYNYPPTTHTSTLSLHDALPISSTSAAAKTACASAAGAPGSTGTLVAATHSTARWASTAAAEFQYHNPIRRPARPRSEETRLNSSHVEISYAVFCLKKKKKKKST